MPRRRKKVLAGTIEAEASDDDDDEESGRRGDLPETTGLGEAEAEDDDGEASRPSDESPLLRSARPAVVVAPHRNSAGPGIPAPASLAAPDGGAPASDRERRYSDTALLAARRQTVEDGLRQPRHVSLLKSGGDVICLHWPVREERVFFGLLKVRRVGAMTVVYEATEGDAKRRLMVGPRVPPGPCFILFMKRRAPPPTTPCRYWHFLLVHFCVLAAVAAMVFGVVVPRGDGWVAARVVGLGLTALTFVALACTALADPGVFPRYFTRVKPDWTYSEYAHAFRPPGTIFCQECQVLVEDYNHFCPWSGTAIGRGNETFFNAFLAAVVASLAFDLVLIAIVLSDLYVDDEG